MRLRSIRIVKKAGRTETEIVMKRKLAFILAVLITVPFAGCGYDTKRSEKETTQISQEVELGEGEEVETQATIYQGKTVENSDDLAIYKFNCTIPNGFVVQEDDDNGRYFASDKASIMIKSQNYKEEFTDLPVFADSAMGKIVYGNMLYQSKTDVSDPIKTKVAGFDAIRYNYDITAYFYNYETDSEGLPVTNADGQYNVLSTEVMNKLSNRVYFFYSDEDVFYVIFETPQEFADEMAPVFDEFIESINITPPGQPNEPREKVVVIDMGGGVYSAVPNEEPTAEKSAPDEVPAVTTAVPADASET